MTTKDSSVFLRLRGQFISMNKKHRKFQVKGYYNSWSLVYSYAVRQEGRFGKQ